MSVEETFEPVKGFCEFEPNCLQLAGTVISEIMLGEWPFHTLFYTLHSKEMVQVGDVKSTGDRLGRWV